jgi:hypothetical protein
VLVLEDEVVLIKDPSQADAVSDESVSDEEGGGRTVALDVFVQSRVFGLDSILCDVQQSTEQEQGKAFGRAVRWTPSYAQRKGVLKVGLEASTPISVVQQVCLIW